MSIRPVETDLQIYLGTDQDFEYLILDTNTGAWDLTDYSATLVVTARDGTVLDSWSDTAGGVTLGGLNGTVLLHIDSTDQTGWVVKDWAGASYTLTITKAVGGLQYRLLFGGVILRG